MSESYELQTRTIEVEGESLEEALRKLEMEVPQGWRVLSNKLISEPVVINTVVQANDEESAKELAVKEFNVPTIVKSIRLQEKGKKGFLGIGKKLSSWELELTPADKMKAIISVELYLEWEPEFILIPENMTEPDMNKWMEAHNIPFRLEDMPVFLCSSKPEFFRVGERTAPPQSMLLTGEGEELFYKDADEREWLIRQPLIQRIRHTFGLHPLANFTRSGFSYAYADSSSTDFAYGCKVFRDSLMDADKIVVYEDLPCVIFHTRTQKNEYWDNYFISFRDNDTSCVVRKVSFRCDAEETARRRSAAELAERAREDEQLSNGATFILQDSRSGIPVRERAFSALLSNEEASAPGLIELLEDSDTLVKWPLVALLIRDGEKAYGAIKNAKDLSPRACLSDAARILEFAAKVEVEEPTILEYQREVIEHTMGQEGYALCFHNEQSAISAFRVFAGLCFAAKEIEMEPHAFSVVLTKSNALYPYILVVLTSADQMIDGYYSSIVCGRSFSTIYQYVKGEELETMSAQKAHAYFKNDVDYALGYVMF